MLGFEQKDQIRPFTETKNLQINTHILSSRDLAKKSPDQQ